MTILGKGLQQQYNTTIHQQYNNTTTKQQTQDYETTRRRYATRRLKIQSKGFCEMPQLHSHLVPGLILIQPLQ